MLVTIMNFYAQQLHKMKIIIQSYLIWSLYFLLLLLLSLALQINEVLPRLALKVITSSRAI
jgi:hypothetical protein